MLEISTAISTMEQLQSEVKRLNAELPNHFGRSNLNLIALSSEDSCFLTNLNGHMFYMPRDLFRANQHCVVGVHQVVNGPIKLDVETDQIHWMTERLPPAGVLVDVGAMLGVVSLPVSRSQGGNVKVIAFEPARRSVSGLRRAITVNNITNIELVEAAVGKESGQVTFAEAPFDETGQIPWLAQTSSMIHGNVDPKAKTYRVECKTLDNFFRRRSDRSDVSVIKIDVEGFEIDVLDGAVELIEQIRPSISIDIHPHPFQPGITTEDQVRQRLSNYEFENKGHVLFCSPNGTREGARGV
jgi:FkbM family methyltransferase